MTSPPADRVSAAVRWLRWGVAAVVAGAAVIAALHVVGPGRDLSPIRLTISEYQLTSAAAVFNAAVLVVAAGAALILAAAGRIAPRRTRAGRLLALLAAALAVAGLVAVAIFAKQDWSLPPSTTGSLHRAASLVAFTALPIAVLAMVGGGLRRADGRRAPGFRLAAGSAVCALAGLAHFTPIVATIAAVGMRGGWWEIVPLGLVERGMAGCEMAALLLAAVWLTRQAGAAPERAAVLGETSWMAGRTDASHPAPQAPAARPVPAAHRARSRTASSARR